MLLPLSAGAYSPDNCWSWVYDRLGGIPPTAEIVPNSEATVGTIAIFYYEKSGQDHFAAVEGIYDNGDLLISECNMYFYHEHGCGYRIIAADYPHLTGFHAPAHGILKEQ